jgi:hypothetical protein
LQLWHLIEPVKWTGCTSDSARRRGGALVQHHATEGELMPTYMLRNIPVDLWTRAKSRAVGEGIPLRVVILKLVELYANHQVHITADFTRKVSRGESGGLFDE